MIGCRLQVITQYLSSPQLLSIQKVKARVVYIQGNDVLDCGPDAGLPSVHAAAQDEKLERQWTARSCTKRNTDSGKSSVLFTSASAVDPHTFPTTMTRMNVWSMFQLSTRPYKMYFPCYFPGVMYIICCTHCRWDMWVETNVRINTKRKLLAMRVIQHF